MDKLFTSVLFFIYMTLSSASLSHRVSLDDLTKTYDLITEKIKIIDCLNQTYTAYLK